MLAQTQRSRPRSNSAIVVPREHVVSDATQLDSASDRAATSATSPMSQLLSGDAAHVGPDEFIELFYRTSAYTADLADTVTARRGRRVSCNYVVL